MERKVYLDSAATTYVSSEVLNEMIPCFTAVYGNSSSLHSFGREAVGIVDRARDRIARAINAKKSSEIYFTSGGTEANNWAIYGLAHANKDKGNHIITSSIEHHSVLEACKKLEQEGFEVTYLPVDQYGIVSLAELMHNIKPTTILISIMAVNNEVGTIQNLKAIGKTAKEKNILFHTDAVQGLGAFRIDVQDMEIDAMSLSAHKIYGPKGCGALYVKDGVKIDSLISGGNQERKKRGGTLNVPAIAGFGKATEIANRDLVVNVKKLKSIRDYFLKQVEEKIPYIQVNGHQYQKSQSILNISFELIDAESILALLDLDGIAVSTGSACTSGSPEKSHVLKAMGLDDDMAQGSIRFSFSKSLSKADVDYAIEKLVNAVEKLRSYSPVTKAGRKR